MQRQAEELIREKHHMRIISEKDFCALLELDPRTKIKGIQPCITSKHLKGNTKKEITYHEF